jgi:hypothetical protein
MAFTTPASREWHDEGMTDSVLDEDRTSSDFDDDFEPFDIEGAPELLAERYLDRELSGLAFNQRVLELAEDPRVPVLERANFLAIFASNLDEFFMVRVAGLERRIATGLAGPPNIGRSPVDVLTDISRKAGELQQRHAAAYQELVNAALADAGIRIVAWHELGETEAETVCRTGDFQACPDQAIAALRGAIPAQAAAPRAPGEATRTSKPAIEASGNHHAPALRFRLTEPAEAPLPCLWPIPPLTSYPAAAAGLNPRAPEDILLPTARLVRRLRALETVFLDPEANILRMRRLLASTPQKILTRRGYDAASAASDHIVNFSLLESVQALADDAAGQLRLDTG